MASRANHRVLLGCALLCAAALLCAEPQARQRRGMQPSARRRLPSRISRSLPTPGWPATPSRPASSSISTSPSSPRLHAGRSLPGGRRYAAGDLPACRPAPASRPRADQGVPLRPGDAGRLADRVRSRQGRPGSPSPTCSRPPTASRRGWCWNWWRSTAPASCSGLAPENRPELKPAIAEAKAAMPPEAAPAKPAPGRFAPVIVIDPGHGGIDNGTPRRAARWKRPWCSTLRLALRDRIEKIGKYRVVMTRTDDTFIPLDERVESPAASRRRCSSRSMPTRCRGGGRRQGATIYTLSDKASDAEAERLAEAENKADAIGGRQSDRRADRGRRHPDRPGAARDQEPFPTASPALLMGEMKSTVRMHKHPLKSAGFRVLKAPDVPSVLVELGYVSNKGDLEHLVSEDWRTRTVGRWRRRSTPFSPHGWQRRAAQVKRPSKDCRKARVE